MLDDGVGAAPPHIAENIAAMGRVIELTRSEAIRRLVDEALTADERRAKREVLSSAPDAKWRQKEADDERQRKWSAGAPGQALPKKE